MTDEHQVIVLALRSFCIFSANLNLMRAKLSTVKFVSENFSDFAKLLISWMVAIFAQTLAHKLWHLKWAIGVPSLTAYIIYSDWSRTQVYKARKLAEAKKSNSKPHLISGTRHS